MHKISDGMLNCFQVIKLYERCVIACASYSEFWIRYVQCMEDKGSLDLANNALARATHVFVKVLYFITSMTICFSQ